MPRRRRRRRTRLNKEDRNRQSHACARPVPFKIPFEGGEYGKGYKRWGEIFLWQHRLRWDEVDNDVNGRAAESTVRLATIKASAI
ncbi:hypothetical protein CN085_31645 [Sinorhizobium meliloti]|nr:hypothetical protein CN085_31645 [Sinorhizobium meliloti]